MTLREENRILKRVLMELLKDERKVAKTILDRMIAEATIMAKFRMKSIVKGVRK